MNFLVRRMCLLAPTFGVLLVAKATHAQEVYETPPSPPPPVVVVLAPPPTPAAPQTVAPARPLRISIAGTLGIDELMRPTSFTTNAQTGPGLGAEVRVQPEGGYGVLLAYKNTAGIFGPSVNVFDAACSIPLFGGRPLHGVSGAGFIDVGPSVGFVTTAEPTPNHTVIGGRATLTLDLHIWNFLLGVTAGYRGGISVGVSGDSWEGEFSASGRAGVVFDVGGR